MRYYTGVGNRKIPDDIRELMHDIAASLAGDGWHLRTGDADGSDEAFRRGAIEIGGGGLTVLGPEHSTPEAEAIAAKFHWAWDRCSAKARNYHGRNVMQVLPSLDLPSKFVICYAWDGCKTHAQRTKKTGGTGTVISVADHYGIPLYNLAVAADLEHVKLVLDCGMLGVLGMSKEDAARACAWRAAEILGDALRDHE